jgi:cation:H+ antiporter
MYILKKIGKERIAVEKSEEIAFEYEPLLIVIYTILGFVGIATGSYVLIESVLVVSRQLGISEYIISFFLIAFGTSLPELVISVSAIRKRHYELALGDIVGSCLVDSTLGIGLGPLFFFL